MELLYVLRRASLRRDTTTVVDGLDWSIPARGVSLLLGPAGTGKSTLLKALSGMLASCPWEVGGYWGYRGRDVSRAIRQSDPVDGVWLCPQAVGAPVDGANGLATALRRGDAHPLILLDEPDRRVGADGLETLVAAIRERATTAAIVVVTHDLSFARRIGDHVCLIAAGRPVEVSPAEDFFHQPRSEAAAHFLRQGNWWPSTPPPLLPRHFHWVIPGSLAGMAYPGLVGEEDTELEAIAHVGIEVLVSTTVEPFPADRLRAFGIEGRHLPIADMGVPPLRRAASMCAAMQRLMEANRPVAVHCRGGLGRTGLLAAAYLVWSGHTGADAIGIVRGINGHFIQTASQENFVIRFAESLGRSVTT